MCFFSKKDYHRSNNIEKTKDIETKWWCYFRINHFYNFEISKIEKESKKRKKRKERKEERRRTSGKNKWTLQNLRKFSIKFKMSVNNQKVFIHCKMFGMMYLRKKNKGKNKLALKYGIIKNIDSLTHLAWQILTNGLRRRVSLTKSFTKFSSMHS